MEVTLAKYESEEHFAKHFEKTELKHIVGTQNAANNVDTTEVA